MYWPEKPNNMVHYHDRAHSRDRPTVESNDLKSL